MLKKITISFFVVLICNAIASEQKQAPYWEDAGIIKWNFNGSKFYDLSILCERQCSDSVKCEYIRCYLQDSSENVLRILRIIEGESLLLSIVRNEKGEIIYWEDINSTVRHRLDYDSLGRVLLDSITYYTHEDKGEKEFIIKKNVPFTADLIKNWIEKTRSKRPAIDSIIVNSFVWDKQGRLAQTVLYGIERYFIYGTPCDSVIVTPPDQINIGDFGVFPMYHKSFGMIPEMGDPEYDDFKSYPHSGHKGLEINSNTGNYQANPEMLKRQIARCEEYKKSQMKEPK